MRIGLDRVSLFAALVSCLVAAAPGLAEYPETASPAERTALDKLASEIDGAVVYSLDDGTNSTIWKVTIGDWKPVKVCNGKFVRWSWDGSKLAVFVPEKHDDGVHRTMEGTKVGANFWFGSLVVVNADGSNPKKVTSNVHSRDYTGSMPMAWLPGDKEIMFVHTNGTGLWKVKVETGEEKDMELPGAYTSEPSISADGCWLVARIRDEGRKLMICDMENRTHEIYGRGCSAAISPDGVWMANNTGGHDQMILHNRLGEGRKEFWAKGIVEKRFDNLHWSNVLGYFAIMGEGGVRGRGEAYVMTFPDFRVTRVTFGQSCDYPDLHVSAQHPDQGQGGGKERAWRLTNGSVVRGQFLREEGDTVYLKVGKDKEVPVPIRFLSAEDKASIRANPPRK